MCAYLSLCVVIIKRITRGRAAAGLVLLYTFSLFFLFSRGRIYLFIRRPDKAPILLCSVKPSHRGPARKRPKNKWDSHRDFQLKKKIFFYIRSKLGFVSYLFVYVCIRASTRKIIIFSPLLLYCLFYTFQFLMNIKQFDIHYSFYANEKKTQKSVQ